MKKAGVGAVFLTVCLDLVGFGIVMPFLALQAREIYGVSEGVATLLGSSYSLAQFFFVPLWGALSDRIGRRPVLLVSVAASALTMLLLGLALAYAESIIWLFLARIFGGIATANLGTATAYIADVTSKEDRVKGMGLIGMAFGLGFIIGPGIGGLLAQFTVGGREGPVACFVAAVLSLINFVWVWRGVAESLPREKRSKNVRRLSPLDFAKTRQVLQHPFFQRVVLSNFLLILAFSALEMTYAFYVTDAFQLSSSAVGWLFVYLGVIAAVVQGGFIRRAGAKYKDSSLILAGLLFQALAFGGIALAGSMGLWMLLVASALLAIGNGLTQPSLSGFLSRRSEEHEQGANLSVHHSFSALARVAGPALGGLFYYRLGMVAPFVLGALLNVTALGLALKLRRG